MFPMMTHIYEDRTVCVTQTLGIMAMWPFERKKVGIIHLNNG